MENTFDLNQPLSNAAFAVFDVETTGLSPVYGHRVCEVGCLRIQGVACFEGKVGFSAHRPRLQVFALSIKTKLTEY